MKNNATITVEAIVDASIEKVWSCWTQPAHIKEWNTASNDWHTTQAENDLRAGGKFSSRMEAKDGSMGFDFGGTYTKVEPHELLAYHLDDGRKVTINFEQQKTGVKVTESFEAEDQNSVEMQQTGWQAILDNFKRYVESQG